VISGNVAGSLGLPSFAPLRTLTLVTGDFQILGGVCTQMHRLHSFVPNHALIRLLYNRVII
jgi:hypothetical protein